MLSLICLVLQAALRYAFLLASIMDTGSYIDDASEAGSHSYLIMHIRSGTGRLRTTCVYDAIIAALSSFNQIDVWTHVGLITRCRQSSNPFGEFF